MVDRVAPACSPRLAVRSERDLASYPLLHFEWPHPTDETPTWPAWLRKAGITEVNGSAGIRFSDEGHVIQAAIAGQGIALLSLVLAADVLTSDALVQPSGPMLDAHPLLGRPPTHPARAGAAVKNACHRPSSS
ncbi:LysR substrate-binding domain-containing protein [Methylobacterium crusticola]|uniref:LysR substrate-binding domain-containing protein n=1 Tax=Methylobacterium crusticola TaxID=1697972 RepID=UPI001EE2A3E2|nr:LysR substrate-binding domain-containing protein [Methylobacterium crusticola]